VPRFVFVPYPSRGDGFLGTGRRFQAIYFLTSGQVESQGYRFPATPLARHHFDGGICAPTRPWARQIRWTKLTLRPCSDVTCPW
jgi:hypothetical protein